MRKRLSPDKKALSSAYRLLKVRDRSEKEIRDRLLKKKYPNSTIDSVIAHLKDLSYIDDKKFSREWVNFRLKTPFGIKRIILELRQKGIDEEIISEALREVRKSDVEREALTSLAKKRINNLHKRNIIGIKARQKLYQFLLRRGFSSSDIIGVLEELN
ncbi:MAG: regulatory protein RecX [Candidatus Omnitrophota bacterium]